MKWFWPIAAVTVCFVVLAFKLHRAEMEKIDAAIFRVWSKQTGNSNRLTFEEWRLLDSQDYWRAK